MSSVAGKLGAVSITLCGSAARKFTGVCREVGKWCVEKGKKEVHIDTKVSSITTTFFTVLVLAWNTVVQARKTAYLQRLLDATKLENDELRKEVDIAASTMFADVCREIGKRRVEQGNGTSGSSIAVTLFIVLALAVTAIVQVRKATSLQKQLDATKLENDELRKEVEVDRAS